MDVFDTKKNMEQIEALKKQLESLEKKYEEQLVKMRDAFSNSLKPKTWIVHPHCSSSTEKIDEAHSQALEKLTNVPREARGNRSTYAKIEHIAAHVNPLIKPYGLSIKQILAHDEYKLPVLITRLSHSSGQWYESRIHLLDDGKGLTNQSYGSSNTYMRRYAVLDILGIGATDDISDTIE